MPFPRSFPLSSLLFILCAHLLFVYLTPAPHTRPRHPNVYRTFAIAPLLPPASSLFTSLTDHFKNEIPASQRYYLLMSHYYLEHPEKAEQVLAIALHLRSSLHMPLIFVLLFHEYVRPLLHVIAHSIAFVAHQSHICVLRN